MGTTFSPKLKRYFFFVQNTPTPRELSNAPGYIIVRHMMKKIRQSSPSLEHTKHLCKVVFRTPMDITRTTAKNHTIFSVQTALLLESFLTHPDTTWHDPQGKRHGPRTRPRTHAPVRVLCTIHHLLMILPCQETSDFTIRKFAASQRR